jgi:hypothetical protein
VHDNTGGAPNANGGTIVSPFLFQNTGHGLYANNSFGNTVIGVLAEGNAGKGVLLDASCVSWAFYGGDIETNTSNAGTAGSDLVLNASIVAAGGQKGGNVFIGVNVGTPPTDNGYQTGRGWLGFPGFGSASGQGTINGEGDISSTIAIAGTTTPGTNTYSTRTATWFKHGRMVTVLFDMQLSGNTVAMAGNLRIAGLPFTALGGMGGLAPSLVNGVTFAGGGTALAGAMNGTNFDLYTYASGGAFTAIPVANILAASGRISGVITYTTAA